MYHSFEAVVSNGKIKPLEKVSLKEDTHVLITVFDSETSQPDWIQLKNWIDKQKNQKKYSSYSSFSQAKKNLSDLSKK